jgi:hypothetical protein
VLRSACGWPPARSPGLLAHQPGCPSAEMCGRSLRRAVPSGSGCAAGVKSLTLLSD